MVRNRMANILFILACCLTFGQPRAAIDETKVPVRIDFLYKNTNLKIKLYDVKESYRFSVARTALVKKLKDAPILSEIKSPMLISEKFPLTFALVVENKDSKAHYFFAAPHFFDPPDLSIHTFFDCLCNGHVYKVAPNSVWFRIVRLELVNSESLKTIIKKNKSFKIIHDFVEVPESVAQKEYKVIEYNTDSEGIN